MCAFLGEANMHEQLFGHLLAVCKATAMSCLYMPGTMWHVGLAHGRPSNPGCLASLNPKHCLAHTHWETTQILNCA